MATPAGQFASGLVERLGEQQAQQARQGEHTHDHSHGHAHSHSHGDAERIVDAQGRVLHSHDGLKPHYHAPIPSAGEFGERAMPLARSYTRRAFTVGIGGPVGTGKTALMLALCQLLRDRFSMAAVTNDIFTREDGDFLEIVH